MDKTLIEYLINIIVMVPIVLILIVISVRLSKSSVETFRGESYAQVIDRFNMTKELSLYVLKIGSTGLVVIASVNNMQVIKELSEEEVKEILQMKKKKYEAIDLSKIAGIDINKLIRKKEDGYSK